jgi:hypothetical protein
MVDPIWKTEYVETGLRDKFGREIGLNIHRAQWYMEPGYYFSVRLQPARTKCDYGAFQKIKFFAAAETREKYIERYVNKFEQRMNNKFGKEAPID